jgi:hypothetical protein
VDARRPRFLALGAIALLASACAGPGAGIADRIRAADSPIVREVFYSPSNWLVGGEERIDVYLINEATDAQAVDLWCTVVIPAGVDQLPPDRLQLWTAGEPGPGGGRVGGHRVLADPICPGDGSVTWSG